MINVVDLSGNKVRNKGETAMLVNSDPIDFDSFLRLTSFKTIATEDFSQVTARKERIQIGHWTLITPGKGIKNLRSQHHRTLNEFKSGISAG